MSLKDGVRTLTDIDAAVAELMGWKRYPPGSHPILRDREAWSLDGFTMVFAPPAFTRSMDAAWPVAEKYGLSVLKIPNEYSYGWQARRWVTERDECATDHAMAPMAICLAALKIAGVEI